MYSKFSDTMKGLNTVESLSAGAAGIYNNNKPIVHILSYNIEDLFFKNEVQAWENSNL